VICEIMKDDGTMARLPDLQLFAAEHGLKIGTIADLIEYRSRTESLVQKHRRAPEHRVRGVHRPRLSRRAQRGCTWRWCGPVAGRRHGAGAGARAAVGARCAGSRPRHALSWSLDASLRHIAEAGPGRGGAAQLRRSAAQLLAQFEGTARSAQAPERGRMDLRTYGIGAQILRECGVHRMQLMGTRAACPA
jgi:3,4-dihydroxy 2-butanone 4-phosphate synthase / GTP cyclohydrolase II